jgi:hypothetical protein
MLIDIQGSIELGNDIIVPIFLKGHHISPILSFACSHNLVKKCVILVLHVPLIYPMREGNWLILNKNHKLIKVLPKQVVKPILCGLPLLEPEIFFPFPSHNLSRSLVIDLCPRTRILGLCEGGCPHVNIVGWIDFLHIKALIFALLFFLLNFCSPTATATYKPLSSTMTKSSG